jgi:1A family penicillin-binding protein
LRRLLALALIAPCALTAQQPSTGEPWRIVSQPQSSEVFARDGSLIGEIGRELRTNVSIRTLPKYVGQAFIAVEDHRFYQHDGVDVVGLAGAVKDNLLGHFRGASTITQQLVGNMHPDIVDRNEISLTRKLREQNAAREMEKHYSKEQILEAYLNQLSFGHGWYGVESAARHYFGKSAAALSLPEAATLAAMPKSPVIYEPRKHPDRSVQRRNLVLGLMAEQKLISSAEAAAAKAAPLRIAANDGMRARAPWFVDVVRVQATRAGIPVLSGGYRIYTSLDPPLQSAAVTALREEAAQLENRPGYSHEKYDPERRGDYLQGAIVAMDPTTGDVRAMVGGRDYAQSQFNRAVDAMRQPGSSFKPFVYAAAIADSIPPTAMMGDTVIAIPLENGAVYRPGNSDNEYLGAITLREALARSRNVVAVQVGLKVGMDSVISLARRMGVTSPIPAYPSSAIGAAAVQPLNLVSAYTAFANLGTPVQPRFIYRIEAPDGKTVLTSEIRALPPALDQRATFVVRDMMRDVVERGTASVIRRYVPSTIPIAGKTGTTNDNSDVWFVGLTPDLVAGVWLGFDNPKTITPGAAGGSIAAPVFVRMIAQYYNSSPNARSNAIRAGATWTPPLGVISGEFDRGSGTLATPFTSPDRRYTEYFIEGTEPDALKLNPLYLFRSGALGF